MVLFKFKKWNGIFKKREYHDGSLALLLVDVVDKQPILTATVWIEDVELEEDEVVIKSYSENEGLLEALVEEGLVRKIRKIPIGFVSGWVVKILHPELK